MAGAHNLDGQSGRHQKERKSSSTMGGGAGHTNNITTAAVSPRSRGVSAKSGGGGSQAASKLQRGSSPRRQRQKGKGTHTDEKTIDATRSPDVLTVERRDGQSIVERENTWQFVLQSFKPKGRLIFQFNHFSKSDVLIFTAQRAYQWRRCSKCHAHIQRRRR